jgi:hypothetical protein
MRVSAIYILATVIMFSAVMARAQSPQPSIVPVQLVREVVYNELHDHASHGYWRFRVTTHTQNRTLVSDQVETTDGPVSRIELADGRPLTPQYEQEEDARLRHLLRVQSEQEQQRRQHLQDEQRIGHILSLLPEAFLFDYSGQEKNCYRLRFRPNPAYATSAIEGRILHAMSGDLWIDIRAKHLVRLDGHVDSNVDFGFGILGRVYKGGWFLLQRTQVSSSEWKTERLEIHMNARALMLKSIARETSETRDGFIQVPAGTNLARGVLVLLKETAFAGEPEVAAKSVGAANSLPATALR